MHNKNLKTQSGTRTHEGKDYPDSGGYQIPGDYNGPLYVSSAKAYGELNAKKIGQYTWNISFLRLRCANQSCVLC